uniref:Uncharacterized protein n=1 Tax=Heliothis virescens TaxID=7102 RepID=A0A2A4JW73_HELVI
MDMVTPDGSGLQDKFKGLKDENKAIEELRSQSKTKIDENNLLVQNKPQENINMIPQKDDMVCNPIKTIDMVTTDASKLKDKTKELINENKVIEETRGQSSKIIDSATDKSSSLLEKPNPTDVLTKPTPSEPTEDEASKAAKPVDADNNISYATLFPYLY